MKNIKKSLALFLCFVLLVSMVGCSGGKNAYPTDDEIIVELQQLDKLFGIEGATAISFTTGQTTEVEDGILRIKGVINYKATDKGEPSDKNCTVDYLITDDGEYKFIEVYLK